MEKTMTNEMMAEELAGMTMNSKPFRIFRNVKKNKRAAAKRRNVLRERARR